MKRFVTILTAIIATTAIALAIVPTSFADNSIAFSDFIKENDYVETGAGAQRCSAKATYENGVITMTFTKIENNAKLEGGIVHKKHRDEPAMVGTPVKFILPNGKTFDSVVDLDGEYSFEYNPEYANRIEYGYDEFGYCTNMSALAGDAVINALYGGTVYAEPVTDNGSVFTWDVFDHLAELCIENWHYDPERKNDFYLGPKDLDKVLNAAKGTHYENLIAEWVNKVHTEREDYTYWQEMQNGNADIPVIEAPVVKANKFTDVTTAHWANKNIEKIANLGYFSGYEDGTFRPENEITHEEFIKVIVDFGLNGTENVPVNPVSANWAEWAQPYLNAALNAGVVTADDADLLAVNTPITRGEMAKVIGRLKTYLTGTNNTAADVSDKIADWNNIPDAYKNYVAEAYNEGILTGYEDGTFKSNKSLTRAEASSVIVKLIDDDEPTTATTSTENVNTIVEPANNVNVTTHRINGTTIEWEFDVPPVILNDECLIALDDVIKHDKGFSYRKSANSVRYTTNIGFFVADMPVSANGEPVDYEFNRWNSGKETIHFDTPIQVINGKIMIPVSVLNVVWTDAPTTWVQN